MNTCVRRVSNNGVVTIPATLRREFAIAAPAHIRLVEREGRLVIEPA